MTEIDSILKDAQSVAVSGHVRPDGDCVGSTLAVYNYIKDYYPDIKARLYLEPSQTSLSSCKEQMRLTAAMQMIPFTICS